MARALMKAVPFLLVLLVVMGSVVVSCATTSPSSAASRPLSVNAGPDSEGRVYTSQVFSRIDRVIVINRRDRAQKTELRSGDWSYDAGTTEIRLGASGAYRDRIVHVEGAAVVPATFILTGFQGEEGDLFVVLDKRLALSGFDYRFDRASATLTFRDDIDPERVGYMIRYQTATGANGMGNWAPNAGDELAYLEAQHGAEVLRRWYDAQDGFYFFKKPIVPGENPRLEKRAATPREMEEMLNIPVTVMKHRFKVSDRAVSREVGFNVATPKELARGSFESWGKTVEETSGDGKLRVAVTELYHKKKAMPGDRDETVMLRISAEEFPDWRLEDKGLLISDATLDLGADVRKRTLWGTSGGLYGVPEVVKLAVYTWKDAKARFEITVTDEASGDVERAIRDIIEFRGK